MGYRVDTTATLVLEGYESAEVSVQIGVPLHALMQWDDARTIEEAWPVFVQWAQPAWDFEDATGPIPTDVDAIRRLPLPMVRVMMRGWRDASVNPPAPLPLPSESSEP